MTDEVHFIEGTHQYFVNGEEYPSVSTVLGCLMDFSRVPRDVLEHKRQIGRAVHRAIELYAVDELDFDTLDPEVVPYFEGWVKFLADKPGLVVESELIVFHKKYRYAGRLDVNYLMEPGGLWQLDVKCVDRMSPATALQTAAYAEARNVMFPDARQITKRAGLQLKPGGYELHPYNNPEHRTDFNYFLNTLNVHRWIVNNSPRKAA